MHDALEALVDAAAAQGLLAELPEGLALLDEVFQPDLAGVHAELVGELVDGGLDGEAALRGAVAAVRAAGHHVRVHDVVAEAARGAVVDRQGLGTHEADGGRAVVAVGAGVGERVEVDGGDGAVLL